MEAPSQGEAAGGSETPPRCRCGELAELRTVRKEGPNHGRSFWGCSRFPGSAACKFFQWARPGATGGRASQHALQPSPQPPGWSPEHAGGSQQQQGSPWRQRDHGSQLPSQRSQPLQPYPLSQQQQEWGQHSQQQQAQRAQQQSRSLHQQAQGTPQSAPKPRFASPLSLAAAGRAYVPLWEPEGNRGVDVDLAAGARSQPQQYSGSQPQQYVGSQPQQYGGSQPQYGGSQQQHGGSQQQHGSSQPLHGGSQPQQYRSSQAQHAGSHPQPYGGSQPPMSPQQQHQLPPWFADTCQQGLGAAAAVGPPAGPPMRTRDGMVMGGQGEGPPHRINLQVVDSVTFGAQFRYHEELKDFIKSLRGAAAARWDPARRLWAFQRAHHNEVLRALQGAPIPVLISPLPDKEPDMLAGVAPPGVQQLADAEVEARLARLPPALWNKLYSFQREGVRRSVRLGGRCLIADEMGLGKTALGVAACFAPEDWPLLIVCPSTMKLVWKEAVQQWLPPELVPERRNMALITDGGSMDQKLEAMDADNPVRVAIVSYDMTRKLGGRMAGFRTVIADESHLLKTLDAQRTQAVDQLVQAARRAILCTGTPALSRPIELYPQVNMLRPGLFGSVQEFGMRYCDGRPAEFRGGTGIMNGYDFRGSSNLQELNQRLECMLMIRRLKKDVLDQLPDKIRKRVPIDTDPAHRAALQETKRAMEQLKRDEASGLLDPQQAAQQAQLLASELYRRTGPAKAKEAAVHVLKLLEAGHKVLVFAHHAEVLDALQRQALERSADSPGGAAPFVRIDGQVTNERRKAAVDRFQHDAACRAALLSITAAGVGITLTAATVVVFAELFWNPGQLVQAEDRAHRLGQRQALEVHYLVAPGTADDAIWEKCKQKLAVVGDALGQDHAEEAFEVPQVHGGSAGRPAARPGSTGAEAEEHEAGRGQHLRSPQQQQRQQQQLRQPGGATATGVGGTSLCEPEVVVISDSDGEEGCGSQAATPSGGSQTAAEMRAHAAAAAEARLAAAAARGGRHSDRAVQKRGRHEEEDAGGGQGKRQHMRSPCQPHQR